jgi:chorismate mutase
MVLYFRAAYVREATRFKATHDAVNVPARGKQVINDAEANATAVHLPQTIAKAVFTAIINSSVLFEYCVVSIVNFPFSFPIMFGHTV